MTAPSPKPSPRPSQAAPAGEQLTTTTGATEPSIGQLVSQASESLSTLVRSEIELAKLELKSTVKNAGTGAGAFIAALVILVFSLTFGFITLAEGIIAAGLDRWLGYLIVFGFLLLLVAVLVFVGIKKVKKVKAPEKTISSAKETVGYLKSQRG